jgi:hypothetical protein
VHSVDANNMSKKICSAAEWVSVVSNSEVLVIFGTLDGEFTARNNSKLRKIKEIWRFVKGSKGRN